MMPLLFGALHVITATARLKPKPEASKDFGYGYQLPPEDLNLTTAASGIIHSLFPDENRRYVSPQSSYAVFQSSRMDYHPTVGHQKVLYEGRVLSTATKKIEQPQIWYLQQTASDLSRTQTTFIVSDTVETDPIQGQHQGTGKTFAFKLNETLRLLKKFLEARGFKSKNIRQTTYLEHTHSEVFALRKEIEDHFQSKQQGLKNKAARP